MIKDLLDLEALAAEAAKGLPAEFEIVLLAAKTEPDGRVVMGWATTCLDDMAKQMCALAIRAMADEGDDLPQGLVN